MTRETGFLLWWQTLPTRMDPFIFEIGSFRLGWYGMMYVAAFTTFYFYCRSRIRAGEYPDGYDETMVQDFLLWGALGLIIGARLGYAVFYNFGYYLAHPLEIIIPFELGTGRYTGISGMSYHGGFIGSVLASWLFFRRRGMSFLLFVENVIPGIPLGYVFGRMGNFINGELYGRATDAPWGMYFPMDPTGVLRHPSQLYEAFLEGVVLFVVLFFIRKRKFARGIMFPIYIAGYGVARTIAEFFRQPDDHIGFVLGPFSLGQLLCFIMIAAGILLGVYQRRKVFVN